MISEQLYHEAQNVIEVYGIDTIAAQKIIENYEEQQTSGLGSYTHQLTVDEIPTFTHNIWKRTDV